MSLLTTLVAFALCLVMSAIFSGSETGFYSLSRVKLETDERRGRRSARLVGRLIRDERGLLITILIGNNLMLELVTTLGDDALTRVANVPSELREVVLTVILTPIIFFAGELVPKDLFRHRPHTLLGIAAPVVGFARILFLPLSLALRLVAMGLERLFGLREQSIERAFGRESVLNLLDEGTRAGTVAPQAQVLAQNVLDLRSIPVERVMVPWREVLTVGTGDSPAQFLERVRGSAHTRLPMVDAGGRCQTYLHQLDALAYFDARGAFREAAVAPEVHHPGPSDLDSLTRPLLAIEPDLPVDRALARMRLGGLRLALVGTPESPLGVVSLKDLVERIAGDLADW